jgi:HicB family
MAESVNTSVRIPAELHERLQREAERQDRSVNYMIVQFIRRGLSPDMPGGLGFDQPYALSSELGALLRRIGGHQIPPDTTLEQLLDMARKAGEPRFGDPR